jgi:hypothetical protein
MKIYPGKKQNFQSWDYSPTVLKYQIIRCLIAKILSYFYYLYSVPQVAMSTKKEPLMSVHTKDNSSLIACDMLCLQNCKLNISSTPIAECFRRGMNPA